MGCVRFRIRLPPPDDLEVGWKDVGKSPSRKAKKRATTVDSAGDSKRQKKSGSAGEGSAAQAKADLQRRESTDKNTFIEEGAHSVRGTPQH